MNLVAGRTIAQAWTDAAEHLLGCRAWTDTTLVLHVSEPTLVRQEDQKAADILDRFLADHHLYSHHTVAETIFPGYEYLTHGVDGVYRVYPDEIYPRIKGHGDMRHWGTYAYRLLRRRDHDGTEYNPLEHCIAKMRDKGRKRAVYELGLGFGCDIATYDDADDRWARMGGPCLSHLSFKVIDAEVHLTALYRLHYYVHRAYGNLLGLARLQAFVAEQAGLIAGPLVCHSTLAVLEHGGRPATWKKREVATVVTRCRETLSTGTSEA